MSFEYTSSATNVVRTLTVEQRSPTDNSITVIEHGANANVERPTYAKVIYWIGSVEPTNALDNDMWVDTSA